MLVCPYLLVIFVLQGLSGTLAHFGTYDTFVGTCNLTGNKSTIYQMTSAALSKANISSAWLPIRRRHLSGWYWLSGAYYDTFLCSDHEFNMMCGVIRAADKFLDCAECNRTYTKFLCQASANSTCAQECLNVRGESYILYNQSGSWYDAKRRCVKENQQLASIDRVKRKELLEKLHEKNKLHSDIWVGLREADYFWHKENKSVFEYSWRQTDPCPCDTENECVVLVKYSSNKIYWKPVNCSSSINFICPKEEEPRNQLEKAKAEQLSETSQRTPMDSTYIFDELSISVTIYYNTTLKSVPRGSITLLLALILPVSVLLTLIPISVCIYSRYRRYPRKNSEADESDQVIEMEEVENKEEVSYKRNSGNECLPDDHGNAEQALITSEAQCAQEDAPSRQKKHNFGTGGGPLPDTPERAEAHPIFIEQHANVVKQIKMIPERNN